MKKNILIAEDDKSIANLVNDYLKANDYLPYIANTGIKAINVFNENEIHMAILDLMLPEKDGFELCREIRKKSNIPILILSAKQSESDKILALGLGADDYIVKPFSPRELVARIKSHFRRVERLSSENNEDDTSQNILKIEDLELNKSARTITINNKSIDCSVKEFDILLYFMENPNKAISRKEIFHQVWGYDNYGDINTVTVHIRRLREKIEKDSSSPTYIQTVWGIGYKFSYTQE